jgi:hypothetical protein
MLRGLDLIFLFASPFSRRQEAFEQPASGRLLAQGSNRRTTIPTASCLPDLLFFLEGSRDLQGHLLLLRLSFLCSVVWG